MIPTKDELSLMPLEDKVALRKKIQKEISIERRNKNLRIETFIPAEKIEEFKYAKNWAFSRGLIPKDTNWAFTKFAVLNMIGLILTEIKTEMELQQQTNKNEDNQNVPIQTIYQQNNEPPELNTGGSV